MDWNIFWGTWILLRLNVKNFAFFYIIVLYVLNKLKLTLSKELKVAQLLFLIKLYIIYLDLMEKTFKHQFQNISKAATCSRHHHPLEVSSLLGLLEVK